MKSIGIIGMGRAGTAMAHAFAAAGYRVAVVLKRGGCGQVESAGRIFPVLDLAVLTQEMDVILIATPDRIIGEIVKELQQTPTGRCRAVLHMSGAMTSQVLQPLQERGLLTGVLHPLQSLARLDKALENLPGSYFTFEGEPSLEAWIRQVVGELGGQLLVIAQNEEKVFYHAGASIVANFLVVLAQMGVLCLQKAGFDEEEARRALVPLMKGTLNNLTDLTPVQALTGPVARGDIATVKAHLAGLTRELPQALPPYLALAGAAADLALGEYLDARQHGQITGIIKEAMTNEQNDC